MLNLDHYTLALLDFDGLLVNTEELHFQAYKIACKNHGVTFDWTFESYCLSAHYDNDSFQKRLFFAYPSLATVGWEKLYKDKKEALLRLYEEGDVHLMPGAKKFLETLEKKKIDRTVVTHSPKVLVQALTKSIPELASIPHWITREDYTHPKPHPECYILAIQKFGKKGGKVVGFEDTPRGLKALMHTPAQPVWVSAIHYPEIEPYKQRGVLHFTGFDALNPSIP